jgi:hypothetical protein
MNLKIPIRAFRDNLLLMRDYDVWAYYTIYPQDIPKHLQDKRESAKNGFSLLWSLLNDYKDYELLSLPQTMDLKAKNKVLEENESFAEEIKEIAEFYFNEQVDFMEKEYGMIYKRKYLLGVKLSDGGEEDSLKKLVSRSFRKISSNFLELFGFEVLDTTVFFQDVAHIEQEVTDLLRRFGGEKIQERELIYHLRQPMIRNQLHNVSEENRYTSIEEIYDTLIETDGYTNEKGENVTGLLKLTNNKGASFIKILPVSDFSPYLLDCELFTRLEDERFPAELHIKCQTSNKGALAVKTHFIHGRIKEEEESAYEHGEIRTRKEMRHSELVDEMKNQVDDGERIIENLSCLVVYGSTVEECLAHAQALKKNLEGLVKVYDGTVDQLRLFLQLHLGVKLEEKNWRNYFNKEAISALGYGFSDELGMDSGFYIGTKDIVGTETNGMSAPELASLSNKRVFINPKAIAEGIKGALYDVPHIAITGKSGKGKTFLAGLIFLWSQMLAGQSLFIDPKAEKKKVFMEIVNSPYYQQHYPLYCEMLKNFHYVTLDGSKVENYGVLDPFITEETSNEAIELLNDITMDLLPDLKGAEYVKVSNALIESAERVVKARKGELIGSLHVIEEMMNATDETVLEYAKHLLYIIRYSKLRLLYSYGENAGLDLNERVTILEIKDLNLPEDNQITFSQKDRESLAIMVALGNFCYRFGSRNKEVDTSIFLTEAWVLSNSKKGAEILNKISRTGRSERNQLVLDTQYIRDVLDKEGNGNYSLMFCFDEESDRENILQTLGLPDTPEIRKEMASMIKGQCWHRDIKGRVGKMNVHSLFEEITESLRTVQKTGLSEAEEMSIAS